MESVVDDQDFGAAVVQAMYDLRRREAKVDRDDGAAGFDGRHAIDGLREIQLQRLRAVGEIESHDNAAANRLLFALRDAEREIVSKRADPLRAIDRKRPRDAINDRHSVDF